MNASRTKPKVKVIDAFIAHPGKQSFALSRPDREIYYGGAKGGGKTYAQIAWFLTWCVLARNPDGSLKYPDFRGLVLRVEYGYLKDWIDKAKKIYGLCGAKAVNNPVEFRFPGGPVIYTGGLTDEEAWMRYQGWGIHKLAIDEVNQIPTLERYLLLASSVRESPDGNPQIFLTGNPGNVGDYWVKRRFVKVPSKDGGFFPPCTPMKDPVTGHTRIFVPATIDDNPTLKTNDPGYVAWLMGMPEQQKRAFLYGDFDAFSGQYFDCFRPQGPIGKEPENADHVIPSGSVHLEPWFQRWGSGDWGYKHAAAFYKFCQEPDGRIHVYDELMRKETGSYELGAELAQWWGPDLAWQDGQQIRLFLSPEAFDKEDATYTRAEMMQRGIESALGPGSAFLLYMSAEEREIAKSDKDRAREMFQGRQREVGGQARVVLVQANDARIAGANYIRDLMRWWTEDTGRQPDMDFAKLLHDTRGEAALNDYLKGFRLREAENTVLPRLRIHGKGGGKDGCRYLVDALTTRIYDDKRPEDVKKTEDDLDDSYDAGRYGLVAHRDRKVAQPKRFFLAEQMSQARKMYQDPVILDQIARRQNERYEELNPAAEGFTLPRAGSMRHRTN